MAFCVFCGFELTEGTKFCPSCGETVSGVKPAAEARESAQTEVDVAPNGPQPQSPDHAGSVTTPTEIQGRAARVAFDGHFVTISRTSALGRMTVGKGVKKIPLGQISGIQLKPAGVAMNGFIQFTVPGGNEVRSKFGHQTFDAVKDENSVVFTKKQQPAFEQLRHEIEQALIRRHAPAQPVAPASPVSASIPEQIEQLARLRESGAITEDEYTAKKVELLSRM